MSKRFGRNQKRRMQQQIDSAAYNEEIAYGQVQSLRASVGRYRGVIEQVADLLGKHFVGLPPETIQVRQLYSGFQMASPAKLEPPPLYPCNQAPEFVEMSLDLLNVYRSELHLNRMTGSTHVYLKSDNGDLAYSISQSGLRNIDKRDLAQHIAKTFAEEIKAKL